MSNINRRLEQMIEDTCKGYSVERAIRKTLGEDIANCSEKIREVVHNIYSEADKLEEKYSKSDVQMAFFQEIDEQYGEDLDAQFQRISDLKHFVGLRNLNFSKEELQKQGVNVEFLKDSLIKTHEAEQKMIGSITQEELFALRNELANMLPDDKNEIKAIIKQISEIESWNQLLEEIEYVTNNITEQNREDMAVLAAAFFLSENKDVSIEEAAAVAAVQIAENEGKKDMCYIWLAVPAALITAIAGLGALFLGTIINFDALLGLGFVTITISTSILAVLSLLAVGDEAYNMIENAIPYINKAWEKCHSYVKNIARKVKNGVATVIGVVANKVFRPAIHWVSNTAIPVIKEKIIYPLKRRLEHLLEWLNEKKEQVFEFFKNAASPSYNEESEDFDLHYSSEDEDENDWAFTD